MHNTENTPLKNHSFSIKDENKMTNFAQRYAKNVKKNENICLFGDLGAGKTTFCRQLIKILTKNSDINVPSPTFTLVQSYEAPESLITHFDLYRLEDPDELDELDWDDAIASTITLIEWPDRASGRLPKTRTEIHIQNDPNDPNMRHITVKDIT